MDSMLFKNLLICYLFYSEKWCKKLEENEEYENLLKILDAAQGVYEDSADYNYLLARALYRYY